MKAFANDSRANMDMAVFVAKNSVCDLIGEITRVRNSKPDQNAFIYLSNHLKHINNNVIKEILTESNHATSKWTTGQLRKFLGDVKSACEGDSDQKLKDIVKHIDNDLSTKNKEDLDEMVVTLQKNIERYINDSKNNLALQHAEVVGTQVAKAYEGITEEEIKKLLEGQQDTKELQRYRDQLSKLAYNLVGSLQDDAYVNKFLEAIGNLSKNTYLQGNTGKKDNMRTLVARMFEERIQEIFDKLCDEQKQQFSKEQNELFKKEEDSRGAIEQEALDTKLLEGWKKQLQEDIANTAAKLAADANLQKLEQVKKLFNNYIGQVEASPDAKDATVIGLNDYIKNLIRDEPPLTDENITTFGQHAQAKIQELLHTTPESDIPASFDTADTWMGDITAIHGDIIKKAEDKKASLVDALWTSKQLFNSQTKLLLAGDTSNFAGTMIALTNEIPHAISALLSDFKKTATTGSSRFF